MLVKSAAPVDPVRSLENSKSMGTDPAIGNKLADRIYYDAINKEITLFKHERRFAPDGQPIWHGYAFDWETLKREIMTSEINFLVKHFEFSRNGKYQGK